MFNDKLIGMMKRGSYIVNTARAKIVDMDAVVRALESGRSPAMRVTFGFRNLRQRIILGAICATTA